MDLARQRRRRLGRAEQHLGRRGRRLGHLGHRLFLGRVLLFGRCHDFWSLLRVQRERHAGRRQQRRAQHQCRSSHRAPLLPMNSLTRMPRQTKKTPSKRERGMRSVVQCRIPDNARRGATFSRRSAALDTHADFMKGEHGLRSQRSARRRCGDDGAVGDRPQRRADLRWRAARRRRR